MKKNPSFFDRGHDTTTVEPLVPHNDRKRGNSKRKLEDDDDIVETRSTKKRCAHHLTDVRSSLSPILATLTTRKIHRVSCLLHQHVITPTPHTSPREKD